MLSAGILGSLITENIQKGLLKNSHYIDFSKPTCWQIENSYTLKIKEQSNYYSLYNTHAIKGCASKFQWRNININKELCKRLLQSTQVRL